MNHTPNDPPEPDHPNECRRPRIQPNPFDPPPSMQPVLEEVPSSSLEDRPQWRLLLAIFLTDAVLQLLFFHTAGLVWGLYYYLVRPVSFFFLFFWVFLKKPTVWIFVYGAWVLVEYVALLMGVRSVVNVLRWLG